MSPHMEYLYTCFEERLPSKVQHCGDWRIFAHGTLLPALWKTESHETELFTVLENQAGQQQSFGSGDNILENTASVVVLRRKQEVRRKTGGFICHESHQPRNPIY